MLRTTIVPSVILSALAAGAGLAYAEPRVVSDPAELKFRLAEARTENDKGITARYRVKADGLVVGTIARNDRLNLTWRAGGKALTTIECKIDGRGDQAPFHCDGEQELDAFGDLTAELTYVVDADDRVIPLSTHALKVGRFWTWYERNGKRLHFSRYQLIPLDLLGSAIAYHGDDHRGRVVEIYTWASYANGQTTELTGLRCAVDGKRVVDGQLSAVYDTAVEAADWRDPKDDQRVPQVGRLVLSTISLQWGTAADLDRGYQPMHDAGDLVLLGEHPGDWSCDLRAKGTVVRTFRFKVGADGRVLPHPEQRAGLELPGSEAMVDVIVPETAPDLYVDPTATKATGFWGQAWRAPDTGARLAPTFSRPGFETAPPKGAKGGKPAKPAKPAKGRKAK